VAQALLPARFCPWQLRMLKAGSQEWLPHQIQITKPSLFEIEHLFD
jgi:hypothetical protein